MNDKPYNREFQQNNRGRGNFKKGKFDNHANRNLREGVSFNNITVELKNHQTQKSPNVHDQGQGGLNRSASNSGNESSINPTPPKDIKREVHLRTNDQSRLNTSSPKSTKIEIKSNINNELQPANLPNENKTKLNENSQEQDSSVATNSQPKKFTGRCRLFIGNLPNDVNEEEFKGMFLKHGEVSETFLNPPKGFGFIKLDYRHNAEKAKSTLDGSNLRGRILRVRFATHGAALKVSHLSQYVSNELLEQAFQIFGEIERAVVIVDDRGKPTGEGIVEFARKPGAQQALRRITEGAYLLTAFPRPIHVEPLEQKDEEDGYPIKFLFHRHTIAKKELEVEPRFAQAGTFEYEFSQKWKELYEAQRNQEAMMKRQWEEATTKLEMEMEQAQSEYETNVLRQDLFRRQEELRRMEEKQEEMKRRLAEREQSGFNAPPGLGVGMPTGLALMGKNSALHAGAVNPAMIDERHHEDIIRQKQEEIHRRQIEENRRMEEMRPHEEQFQVPGGAHPNIRASRFDQPAPPAALAAAGVYDPAMMRRGPPPPEQAEDFYENKRLRRFL